MICPKCKNQYDVYNADKCPITDIYICPNCRVGLTEADADPNWKQELNEVKTEYQREKEF